MLIFWGSGHFAGEWRAKIAKHTSDDCRLEVILIKHNLAVNSNELVC